MVAEPWILKMGNQVSHNLKTAFSLDHAKKKTQKKTEIKEPIGILSFEVANVMSKTVHLHKSLTDQEVSKLKNETLKSEGVIKLVSEDESYLLELALTERLDDLNRVASVVSRLGKKCTEPALLGFEHIYNDIVTGRIDVKELGFLVKDMDGMIRKMERYVGSTAHLCNELEVLNELELATKKFQQNQLEESRRAFEQKVIWQGQDVAHLKEVSLWNQSYDKIVALLARTICTIYARICNVFEDVLVSSGFFCGGVGQVSHSFVDGSRLFSGQIAGAPLRLRASRSLQLDSSDVDSGMIEKLELERSGTHGRSEVILQRREISTLRNENFRFACGTSPGRLFMDCLSLSTSGLSKLDDDHDGIVSQNGCSSYYSASAGIKREIPCPSGCLNRSELGPQKCNGGRKLQTWPKIRQLTHAPPSTVGGSALALHYANVIIIIEKLLRYPHLVGEEARDDLYQMLPTSLRMSLRKHLKSYVKSLAIYDAPLAHDWEETLDKILRWLAPLAHNMIRWQTERNFEQHQIVARTNVLLLQTLYFADKEKTETAICELLVGLNYICRYEHQQNALLDCTSSAEFDNCMDWQMQYFN
ncbi:protein PSK SIMULATOR 1-like [Aristolochia californica]|uniref:protein PSK SIMULATOR 1-like n=1 Tax=Aristolochia californica TaxID=171875 RepID=UPI0035DB4D54